MSTQQPDPCGPLQVGKLYQCQQYGLTLYPTLNAWLMSITMTHSTSTGDPCVTHIIPNGALFMFIAPGDIASAAKAWGCKGAERFRNWIALLLLYEDKSGYVIVGKHELWSLFKPVE